MFAENANLELAALILVGPRFQSWAETSCRCAGIAAQGRGGYPPGAKAVVVLDLESLLELNQAGSPWLSAGARGTALVLLDNDSATGIAFVLSCGAVAIPSSDLHLLPTLLGRLFGACDRPRRPVAVHRFPAGPHRRVVRIRRSHRQFA